MSDDQREHLGARLEQATEAQPLQATLNQATMLAQQVFQFVNAVSAAVRTLQEGIKAIEEGGGLGDYTTV